MRITESEKKRIIGLYNRNLISEQDATIAQLQSLIGVSSDNVMGPKTVAKLKELLGTSKKNEADKAKLGSTAIKATDDTGTTYSSDEV